MKMPQGSLQIALMHPQKSPGTGGVGSPTGPKKDYWGLLGPTGIYLALIGSLRPLSRGPFEVWDQRLST